MANENAGPQPSDLTTLPLFQAAPAAVHTEAASTDEPQEQVSATSAAPAASATAAGHLLRATTRAQRQPAPVEAPEETPEQPDEVSAAPAQSLPPIATAAAGTRPRHGGTRTAAEAFEEQGKIPWDIVAQLRDQVSKKIAEIGQEDPTLTDEDRERLAGEHAAEMLQLHVDTLTRTGNGQRSGEDVWSKAFQADIIDAVLNAMFRLGRLQPLVEIEGVENIDIVGYDNVWLTIDGGTRQRFPHPISTSNEALEKEINFIATRRGEGGRSFNASRPALHLDLAGGARLAANAMPIVNATSITIRVHRHLNVTLDDMVAGGTMPRTAANLLAGLVRSGASLITNGYQSSGKTTLLRALADEIPPHEKIATIEMERELHIHQHPDKHPVVIPFEYRPGEGEPGPDGVRAGEYTLIQAVRDSLRHTTDRLIVGEVRGDEVDAMLQAMQSGVGSMSTLHSQSPQDAIERLVTLLLRSGQNVTPAYAYRQIAQNIDVIVQMAKIRDARTGKMRRAVTSICEIRDGEDNYGVARPTLAPLFDWDKDTQTLVPRILPSRKLRAKLADVGFDEKDLGIYQGEAGQ